MGETAGESAFYGLVILLIFGFGCLSLGVVGIFKPMAPKFFRITTRYRASLAIAIGCVCLAAAAFLKADIEQADKRLAALRAGQIKAMPCKILIGSWQVVGSSVGLMLHFDVDRTGKLVGAVTTSTRKKSWSKADCQRRGKLMTVHTTAPKNIRTVFKTILPTQLQVMSMSIDGVVRIDRGRNLSNGMATFPIVKVTQ